MTTKTKRILGAVAAIAVIGGIVAANVIRERRSRTEVETGKVERFDLTQVVTASGEVRPRRYVNVGTNVSGRIVELPVKEGDTVEEGQVLARIDSERYEAGERQSRAAVAAARAELQRAEADLEGSRLAFERTKQMHEDKLVSQQAYDQAEADFKMKTANVEAASRRVAQVQAQLDSTTDELNKTTVYAPMSGVVTSLPKEEGEMVIGAMSFNPTVLMTVADLSVMEAEVMVDETDIRNLKVGQKAVVEADALEGLEIEGEVTEIGASAIVRGSDTSQAQAQLGANTGNQPKDFKVKIVLKDPPPSLRPGLNASADITTATREHVLAVPIQAVVVREVDEEGKVIVAGAASSDDDNEVVGSARKRGEEKDGVFVVQDEKAVFTPVKTGIMGDTEIEITEGLEEGQQIVTGSYRTLRTLENEARLKIENKGESES
ncbi:MAG: efflux RND transporter periplasmic adaptor subunit [Acidobacteria bacterium]|jgi:HlyD family secretion protein|nr:efflux RND transporter periplasmic adaptor subunit [Acidobacteriota bacterium]